MPLSDEPRRRRLRRLALACVLLMLVVVMASAWLRLAQPRPGCLDWPGCRDAFHPALPDTVGPWLGHPHTLTAVRAMHRVAASALLPVLAVMAWLALARRPHQAVVGRRALAMLGLALVLAALGIVTPGARSPAVLLGNLLGGQLLLALAWSTLRGLRSMNLPLPTTARWARWGAALWLLQSALGALSGAGYGQAAAVTHLLLLMPALLWAGVLGVVARRQGCADARVLLAVVVVQMALGAAAVALAAPPALVQLHNASAALGLAVMFGLGHARRC